MCSYDLQNIIRLFQEFVDAKIVENAPGAPLRRDLGRYNYSKYPIPP